MRNRTIGGPARVLRTDRGLGAHSIGEHADANSHIVLETPLEHQALKIPPPPPAPTRHPGWNP